MLIDTHCHLDDSRFSTDLEMVIQRAREARVARIIIPAVGPWNFQAVRELAHRYPGGAYALGIHPLFIARAQAADLEQLDRELTQRRDDPLLVAVGEIGLDFFVPELKKPEMQSRQERFFQAQLRLARKHRLPVILHVRRAQDRILKYLRQISGLSGVAHAFNGSLQQAQQFLDLGFMLGVGGAMTFPRARQIRRLVADIGIEHWVLETDAPDIPPAWLFGQPGQPARNEPAEVKGIARAMADVRQAPVAEIIRQTGSNACRLFFPEEHPRLRTSHNG